MFNQYFCEHHLHEFILILLILNEEMYRNLKINNYLVFSAIPTVSPRDSASLMTLSQSPVSPPQLDTSRNNLNKDKTSYSYFRVKLQQRVRFYSLERSSPLLDIGHKT